MTAQRIISMRYGSGANKETGLSDEEQVVLLWENSAPTSSFSAQDVVLSQPANIFTSLRIIWKQSDSMEDEYIVDYDLTNIDGYLRGSQKSRFSFNYSGTSYHMSRGAYFTDDNYDTIHFYATSRYGASGTNNHGCIPIAIYGITRG